MKTLTKKKRINIVKIKQGRIFDLSNEKTAPNNQVMTTPELKEYAQQIANHIFAEDMTVSRAASMKRYYLEEMNEAKRREILPLIDEALRELLHTELYS